MERCIVCGKEGEGCCGFVGCICLDCFKEVGGEVCCICGEKVDRVAKEYVDYGLTERGGVVDVFHGLLCEECASNMVQCKVCSCFVPVERIIDYKELGTGMATGEALCYECYIDNFIRCSECGGLIPKSVNNVKWDKKGRVVCLVCVEKFEKVNVKEVLDGS